MKLKSSLKHSPSSNLTVKQTAVLNFIQNAILNNNKPPTIREIGAEFGFQSTGTTRGYLKQLHNKGHIRLGRHQARSIELPGRTNLKIPLLGNITAGTPNFAEEDIDRYFNLEKIFPTRDSNIFGLKVIGDSMIEKGIQEGDIAIVRKQQNASNNDIVVALLESEATIKILKIHKTGASLNPANKNYDPINKPFSIIGKVIAVIKQFS
ncbi:MAG: transcriptional repressor LexA [Candidatus Omnitrophota bacterium]